MYYKNNHITFLQCSANISPYTNIFVLLVYGKKISVSRLSVAYCFIMSAASLPIYGIASLAAMLKLMVPMA